ncbi:MAG: glycosyltransferase [Erysipelotrichaceae bacterium]|nr:glycosyltransferase [Erysipelotrichaceae bacterium]
MKLSVIVPVYNVEKYLDKCLDSLVCQGIDDYEIIVVNDGTKDNSQDIIDRYVKEYPNIVRSFIKENGGLSDARNYGIKHATGEYITFLDSDDYVEKDLYKNMLALTNDGEADLVVADLQYEFEDGSEESFVKEGLNRVDDNDINSLFLSPLFSWNKLYKKELFDELKCQYPVGLWYEDIPVTLKFFSSIKNVAYYSGTAYHYLQRSSSIMGSSYNDKMYDIFTIFEGVVKDFKERNVYDKFHDELEYLLVEHFLVYGAFRFLRTEHYKEMMPKAFKFVKEYFPGYKKNKYIKTLGKKNEIFLMTNNKLTMPFWHWYLTK